MSELLKDLKHLRESAPLSSYGAFAKGVARRAITALSPALPDDVAVMIDNLKDYSEGPTDYWGPLCDRAADLLERQARESAYLVERLRDERYITTADWILREVREAADRIEQLETSDKDKSQLLASFRSQIKELEALLKAARCPNCSGDGVIAHGPDSRGDWEFEQCQWCDERAALQENK